VWNNDGLEFFYTAERNWMEVYNSKEQLSVLVNGWEMWEPNNETRKDPIRTKWRREELGATNARGVEREQRGNLRGGCMVCRIECM
jgi:hypothetical protein